MGCLCATSTRKHRHQEEKAFYRKSRTLISIQKLRCMMMRMVPSFSSSSLACTPKFSLYGNPKLFRRIKNLKIFPTCPNFDPSRTQQLLLTHSFVDSPLRASAKCFSKGPSSAGQENQELVQEVEDEGQVYEFERLFSNLNQATLKREPGSLSSSIFLVAGTTVGAGILAIPAVTQEAGFLASAIICILCWIFMVVSGLLIAEVNVNTMCELGSGGVSLVSMAKRTLGNVGVQVACWSYIFIHYALLVAYVARSSDILTNFLGIPLWEMATLFSLLFGGLCYFGSQRIIGAVNGALVVGIIASFTALVVVASGDLHWDALLQANLEAAPRSIPIIALSFVYQNVVPVLCTNLEGDLSKVRTAIILGTAIPLALFLVWNAVILGTITTPELGSDTLVDPLQQLRSTKRSCWGLSDFLADLLKLPSGRNKPLPYLLTLVPPLILALLDPEIFFKALDFAGTYGVLVLFGVLPAAMSWSDRYSESSESLKIPPLVPGGKLTLSLVMGGAGLVILTEILENFGHA
ncbi:UNVERIFIED_CONTAM: Tyrosine-specific transport protein [Sesamum latifolium]|uniref:Tyrosine-specific transport protein n=1 Tax=Sesamum latifolium TaxID=2727402 RepID=A0AAW2Y091_9LAMI